MVVRLHQHGFEPVVHLVPVAVTEGGDTLTVDQIRSLLGMPMKDGKARTALAIDARDLEDAIEEALFVLQGEIDTHEQTRFEEVVGRIERAIEDRIVVLVRQRNAAIEKRRETERRRETATGADARNRVDKALAEIDHELEAIDDTIARLRAREDPDYELWIQQAHQRR